MTTTNFVSINSVLYDLSTVIPEEHWNKTVMLEWIYKGLGKLRVHTKFQEALCVLEVISHKAQLPKDWKYITQIAYKETFSDVDATTFQDLLGIDADQKHMANPTALAQKAANATLDYMRTNWTPMRLASNPFTKSIHTNISIFPQHAFTRSCPECKHEYTVDPDGCITTTLPNGYILLSYLRNPKGNDGHALIPDNEDLKEALVHYALFRYFMVRAIRKEQGAHQERDYHRAMFSTLKTKAAGALNSPSLDQLENIKNQQDHLVPRSNRWDGMFSKLNQPEIESDFYNTSHNPNSY